MHFRIYDLFCEDNERRQCSRVAWFSYRAAAERHGVSCRRQDEEIDAESATHRRSSMLMGAGHVKDKPASFACKYQIGKSLATEKKTL